MKAGGLGDFGKGSLFTANLLRTNQFDVEKTGAVSVIICRDLMQDYAYLLNGRSLSHGQSPIYFWPSNNFKMNRLFGPYTTRSVKVIYLTVCWRI